MTRWLVWSLLFLLLGGCSPFVGSPDESVLKDFKMVEGVPSVAQEHDDDCGPAALAALFGHRGEAVPVAEIRQAVYDPRLGGSLLADMENFAWYRGIATRSGTGSLSFLEQSVDAGQPVLILVETGLWRVRRPHYLVVFGYDRDRFLARDGSLGTVLINKNDLDRRWAAYNRLFLFLE